MKPLSGAKKSPYVTGSKGKLIDYGMDPVFSRSDKILLRECEGTMEKIRRLIIT